MYTECPNIIKTLKLCFFKWKLPSLILFLNSMLNYESKLYRSFLLNGSVIFFLAYSKPCGFLMDKLCRDLNFRNQSSPGILFLNGLLMLFVSTDILTASITSLLERPNPHFSIVLMQFAKRISSSDDKAVRLPNEILFNPLLFLIRSLIVVIGMLCSFEAWESCNKPFEIS
jgi:hypothetical protein